ncbi:VacJ family lipoprotein [Xanthomonas rydalmerensis]|uniref:VacJ family lipoprotein n=1 Tax=Xanthomonas rydalmerensis TaxID=3046274 RepID=A0ABZ0JPU9_9XANT|nr:VacJ family lipoprotein [Xanthomonas sp. DM-2023]WOS41009.1 VacJ family lipoprotein [Xanthomonas sp. DM-2023]WOS45194.1 VacJ family lipoprotein [Xanthomonas sp. DM-2023]WOS49373.1 VacJ family lipoprotein [Xanthomonas sp. DM-2023]WOS53553.1 VacJ family lipoprotein [Xanthomonas sp. DM-2023]WOS57736.1 VacJ family lipoprotein [Xanthomonas sp. DM-2023]
MNVLRILTSLTLAAALGACAGAPKRTPPPPPPPTAQTAPAAGDSAPTADANAMAASTDSTTGMDASATPASSSATVATPPAGANGAPTSAEDDYAALYGSDPYNPVADPTLPAGVQAPPSYDPWEKYNRKVHAFNNVVDRAVARPLARAYVNVVPRPVRLGVTNFFDNLSSPLTMVNQLLQGRPLQAGQTLSRFLINSTLGIGGIFDPATDANLPRRSEDFGQTLGVWGWRRSRYLELPLFGPRTVRDTFGLVGDAPLSPLQQIEEDRVRVGLQGLQLVDTRAQLLSLDSLRDQAPDEYQLTRDAWLQRRNYQIESDMRGHKRQDDDLPAYLREEETNPTVPVDAMPVPEWRGGR